MSVSINRQDVAMEVFADLVRVVHGISQAGARELRREDLTPAQYQVLVTVAREPDCLQRQVSDRLGVTKGNVSMLISRLEAEGLLTRTPVGAGFELRLTRAGRTLLKRLVPAHATFIAAQFDSLSDADLLTLSELIKRLQGV